MHEQQVPSDGTKCTSIWFLERHAASAGMQNVGRFGLQPTPRRRGVAATSKARAYPTCSCVRKHRGARCLHARARRWCVEREALPHTRCTRELKITCTANKQNMGCMRGAPFARGILYNQLHAGMFGMRSAAGCGARSLTHRITLCACRATRRGRLAYARAEWSE